MSIVALKRKTQAQYKNVSVGQSNFSLNGTHRNQGFIGQTSLSRSLPRTPMKGATPKGHGGCCGFYPKTNIVQSAVTSTEDPSVIKQSTGNTSYILSELHNMTRVNSKSMGTVKPDSTQMVNTSGSYLDNLKNRVLNSTKSKDTPVGQNTLNPTLGLDLRNKSNPLFQTAYTRNNSLGSQCNIVKSGYVNNNCNINPTTPRPMLEYGGQDDYITMRKRLCTNNDVLTVIKNTRQEPFAGFR